ncbi:MAG: DUF4382 domain-containing protein [Myxococcota bacterium]|nr:DUF4382 domain-containing protein [Myxococcota bacterium]
MSEPGVSSSPFRPTAVACLLLWFLVSGGCDAGAQDDAKAGSLNILITDAPSEEFQAVHFTLTEIALIGEGPDPVVVFSGRETFDLLALRDVSELFSMTETVPSGRYRQLRLTLADRGIELFDTDDSQPQALHYPDLPQNNTLTVGLQPALLIRGGESHVLQIDFDLDRSIQWSDSGRPAFRPIIAVQPIKELLDGRLTRLQGHVEEIDIERQTLSLCRLRRPLAWLSNQKTHGPHPNSADHRIESISVHSRDSLDELAIEQKVDPQHPWRRCIEVSLSAHASVFDSDGSPILLEEIEEESPAVVVGRVRPSKRGALTMFGTFIGMGQLTAFPQRRGWVVSDLTLGDDFLMEPIAERNDLVIQLFPSTQLFERSGWPVSPEAIRPGVRASVTGVVFTSPDQMAVMTAALLVIDFEHPDQKPLEGKIVLPHAGDQIDECPLALDFDGFRTGMTIETQARIIRIHPIEGITQPITVADLDPSERVEIYGQPGDTAEACYRAESIIAFPTPSENTDRMLQP